jgi:mono/diheme cytochrome c family protein
MREFITNGTPRLPAFKHYLKPNDIEAIISYVRTVPVSATVPTGGGDDDVMREFITNGTPRMPAFKHYLKPNEIEAIISYVRTVPVSATVPTGGGGGPRPAE